MKQIKDTFSLSSIILDKFNEMNITTVEDVCKLNRTDLKEMGFKNKEINDIIIQLQLNGLSLNKKKH